MNGIGVAPGWALAKQLRLTDFSENSFAVQLIDDAAAETEKFLAAIESAAVEIEEAQHKTIKNVGNQEGQIFEAQLLMIRDKTMLNEVNQRIALEKICAQAAFTDAIYSRIQEISSIDNEYLRERILDLRDIHIQVISKLLPDYHRQAPITEEVILFGCEITPSQLVKCPQNLVKGMVMENGGITSHTVIIAGAMNIPCIVGAAGVLAEQQDGELVLISGDSGEIIFKPDTDAVADYNCYIAQQENERVQNELFRGQETKTKDGQRISLLCNIASAADGISAVANDGEGAGLLRTEFLYMNSDTPPDEQQQYDAYMEIIQSLQGKPLVIRTLDAGGDKPIPSLHIEAEANPFMGVRAIRYCLKNQDVFRKQLAAILRAAYHAQVSIMFPMIATVDEIRLSKQILAEVQADLSERGINYSRDIPIGMMVETASAAIMADKFAQEVDFFSIGTNDLTQYLYAADRGNSQLAYLNDPYDPALLRMVAQVAAQGVLHHKPVAICGQTAQDQRLIPLWIAMGVTELSISSVNVLKNRAYISTIDKKTWADRVEHILNLSTAKEVKDYLNSIMDS